MRLLLFFGREQVHRNNSAEPRAPARRHRLRRQQPRLPPRASQREHHTLSPSWKLSSTSICALPSPSGRSAVGYGGRPPFARPRWKGESRARLSVGNRFAKARQGWCARAWAKTLANGGRSRGSAAAREEEGADGWDLPVSVPQRVEEGGSDERDSPVSDRVKRESARSARMGRPAGLFAGPLPVSICFPFSFSI